MNVGRKSILSWGAVACGIQLLVCFLPLTTCVAANTAAINEAGIPSLNFNDDRDLSFAEGLLSHGNLLDYFSIREKLLSLTYDDLNDVFLALENRKILGNLKHLVIAVMAKQKNEVFSLQEDIFVNNVPFPEKSPFYPDAGSELKISELKPYAEHAYFYNLALNHCANKLTKKDDFFWVGSKKNEGEERGSLDLENKDADADTLEIKTRRNGTIDALWTYRCREELLANYPQADMRQWVKTYEEPLLFPTVYGDRVILRNEYRIFCLDRSSGEEIWSFANEDKSGRENYKTVRHPHQNSYGGEFLLANEVLYTELNGRLIAIDLKRADDPKLLWECGLGEYTVASKPVLVEDILIVGLINAKGEFWFCGFQDSQGEIEWTTYIGTSSFLSPVSAISAVFGNQAVIATNHGILACLYAQDGTIVWIRKYTPKKHSYYKYWNDLRTKDIISYDTGFLQACNRGFLYYKPRESDFLYVLDPKDGQLKERVLIDSDRFYLLGILAGDAVLLEKATSIEKNAQLKITELTTGKLVYGLRIEGSVMLGASNIRNDCLIFKTERSLHKVEFAQGHILHESWNVNSQGWLMGFGGLNSPEIFLFTGDRKKLQYYDFRSGKFPANKRFNEPGGVSGIEKRRKIEELFGKLVRINGQENQAAFLRRQLISEVLSFRMPLEDLVLLIDTSAGQMQNADWIDFFFTLSKGFGNEVIDCHGVRMRFSNFLLEKGLLKGEAKQSEDFWKKSEKEMEECLLTGDSLLVLPIQVVKGSDPLDFFLVLKNEQLLCVNDAGVILWEARVASPEASVKAFLYEDIVIVCDDRNVIALNAKNGTFIWSVTSLLNQPEEESDFIRNTIFPEASSNDMRIKFVGDKAVIAKDGDIFLISLRTGYCKRTYPLRGGRVTALESEGNKIYLLRRGALFYDLSVFNDQLEITQKFNLLKINYWAFQEWLPRKISHLLNLLLSKLSERRFPTGKFQTLLKRVGFLKNFPEMSRSDANLMIGEKRLALGMPGRVYVLDKQDGELKGEIKVGGKRPKMSEIIIWKDKLLIVEPLANLKCYDLNSDRAATHWTFNFSEGEPDGINQAFYFAKYSIVADGKILAPFNRRGQVCFVALDIRNGEKMWEITHEYLKGEFYDMSVPDVSNGNVSFIIAMKSVEDVRECYVTPVLYCQNISDGSFVKIEREPSVTRDGFGKAVIVETRKHLICTVRKHLFRILDKNKWFGDELL